MPIEIKELHIKAVVATGGGQLQEPCLKQEDIIKLKKELTKTITRDVIKIIQLKNER